MKAHAYQLNFYEMYTCSRRRFRILNIDMSRSVYIISKSQSVRDRRQRKHGFVPTQVFHLYYGLLEWPKKRSLALVEAVWHGIGNG